MKGIKAYRFLDCVLIHVCDENVYRFFSVCASYDIQLYELDLRIQDDSLDEYYIYVRNKDLDKLNEASIKTGVGFSVIKESGVVAFLRKIFKRRMFFISIFVGAVFLYILTLFIWQIQISGCVNHTDEEILSVVNSTGAYYGKLKKACDCEAIEEAIRNEFEDVLWVSASINGTGLIVQIKENTYLNDKMAINDETADLTADFDGTVIDIVTRTGVPLVQKGDEIKAGDILISGVEEFYNDAAEVYKTEHVFADGDIIVESGNSYKWEYNKKINVKKTVDVKHGIELFFFDKRIVNYHPKNNEEKYYLLENNGVFVIGEDLYLPLSYKKTEYKIYESEERILSNDALKLYAGIMYKMFCLQEEAKGVDIIEKNAKISFSDSGCTVESFMLTHRICGVHTPITVEPIIEQPKEEETN